MSQETINERLKFLIENSGMSVRAFSSAMGVTDTNTRNYIDRGAKPNSEFLEKLLRRFSDTNPTWLLLGEGEPFLSSDTQPTSTNLHAKKISRSQFVTKGKAVMNDGEKDLIALAAAQKDIQRLQEQLATKDALLAAKDDIIAAKEEMLSLLRSQFNRPN